jgi:polyisoprenyl-phosphate glycosyltransferase
MTALDAAPPRKSSGSDTVIVVPIFDDWTSLDVLVTRLDAALAEQSLRADLLVVDDASVTPAPERTFAEKPLRALARIDVLRLRHNLGHQRAIAIGLAYVENVCAHDVVVVMDGDGEDNPSDVPRLVARLHEEHGQKIVFAERTRRSESLTFRVCYFFYRAAHRFLTGRGVRVGNFSALPRPRLASLVAVSALWNHYAAAAYQSRQPSCTIPTQRAPRIHGTSRMNAVALVAHGLSAISVQSEIVGVRLVVMALVVAVLAVLGLLTTLGVRILTDLAIPGWATYTAGILTLILFQALLSATVFSFMILAGRQGTTFLPLRDYRYYVGSVTPLVDARAPAHASARLG